VVQIKTSVFATSNTIKNLSAPLQSRFFIVELEPYTYDQFFEITKQLLSHQKIEQIANLIASAVWARSQDMRDCIKIGSMAKTIEDVDFLINMLHSRDAMGKAKLALDVYQSKLEPSMTYFSRTTNYH
jgi:ATP-dependent Lon protease